MMLGETDWYRVSLPISLSPTRCCVGGKERSKDKKVVNNVSAFLQKLEYYPSLLFLTTNRPGTLDPALQSRIHLTINYPALDPPSRLTIWRNFLMRTTNTKASPSNDGGFMKTSELDTVGKFRPRITEEEIRLLASLELDGRKIKNLVKSAGIMARRGGRGVEMGDLRRVLRITEGVEI
jgi:SpoVK/Ycf46/Vps4 family AAA+-type ATPase